MAIKIEGQISIDTKSADNDLQKFARDSKKELDQATLIKLEVDLAGLKVAKREAQKELKELQKGYEEGLIPKSAVIEAQRALDNISSKTTEANRELQNYRNTGEKGLSRLGVLFNGVTDEIQKSREELVRLGKSSKVLDNFDTEVKNINQQFEEGKIDIKQYKDEVGKLETELKNAGGGFDNIIGKLGDLKGFLTGGAILGVGAVLVNSVKDIDEAFKKIEGQTGATGVELDGLKTSLIELNNKGLAPLDDNLKTIGTLNKELGLSGEELTKVAIGTTTIANIFNKDVNETLRATTALMKNYGLSGTEANDFITKSLQSTGDTYDDILDSINEYSAIASDAKIPVQDFINVLLNGTKAGIRNTDELADVQREFAIRLRDGSKSSQEALGKLGLSYDDLKNGIATGETTISKSMQDIAKEILAIEDPLERTQIGTALLGTKFEDNGDIILEVLANVKDELGNVEGANDKLVKTSETGFSKLSNGWNSFTGELKNIIYPAIDGIAGAFGGLFSFVGKGIANLRLSLSDLGKIPMQNNLPPITTGEGNLAPKSVQLPVVKGGKSTQSVRELLKGIKPFGSEKGNTTEDVVPAKQLAEAEKAKQEAQSKILAEAEKKRQADLKKIIDGQKITGGGAKKTAKEIVKTEEEKQKELEKIRQEEVKKEEEKQKNLLNIQALSNIERVKNSNKTEGQKAKSILEINEKLQKDLAIIGETENQKTIRLAQERIKKEEDYSKNIEGIFKKAGDIQEDYRKKVEEVGEEFKKLKNTALENIKAINESLEDLETETDTKLAEQRVRLLEQEKKIQEDLANLQQDGSDFEKRNELLKEQISLQKELALIEANVNTEVLKAVEERSKLSDTERILADAETQKAILEERKLINEAIANGEEILLSEIQDKKNLALAEELIARRDNLNNELDLVKQNYDKEIKALQETDEYKRKIQKDYTQFVKGEIDKQVIEYNRLRDARISRANARRSAGVVNQNTTTNNLNQNITVSNQVDGQSLVREINKSFK